MSTAHIRRQSLSRHVLRRWHARSHLEELNLYRRPRLCLHPSPFHNSYLAAPLRFLNYVNSISAGGSFIHMVYSGVNSVYTVGLRWLA
jgi:hypothetical protein